MANKAKAEPEVVETEVGEVKVSESAAVTVITNTEESIRAHYPKIAAEIKNAAIEKAKPEWQKQERERLSALNVASADDPKFANESFVAGLTVEQAKAKRHDDLAAKLKEAEAKIQKTKEEVPFVASDSQGKTNEKETINEKSDPLPKIEAEARAKWNKDPNIEKEFGDFKTYLAYCRAHAAGSFRLLQRPVVVT